MRGGVLLLRSLLDQTGGDPGLAAAGYYQGLASVREHGLFPSTQQYVANVLALQQPLRRSVADQTRAGHGCRSAAVRRPALPSRRAM